VTHHPLVLVVRRKMEGEEEEESGLMEVLFCVCVCFWLGVCTTTSIVFIIVLGCHYWGLILL
jgi:hypothetical protein